MPNRQLSNWLLSWTSLFDDTNIPTKYTLWSGLFAIAATLQNKVWFDRGGRKIYPNLFVWIVGEPATGKGIPTEWAMRLLRGIQGLSIHSGELTKTWLLKTLEASAFNQRLSSPSGLQSIVNPSLVIHSDELATTLPSNGSLSTELLNHLVSMYMVPDFHQYGTDKHGLMTIEKPLVNWIANTSPRWLHKAIPPHFIDTGLIARVNTITAPFPADADEDITVDEIKFNSLLYDLTIISAIEGEFTLDHNAVDRRQEIKKEQHKKRIETDDEISRSLQGREGDHSLKLAMVLSAAVRDDRIITEQIFETATNIVNEARDSSLHVYASSQGNVKVQLKHHIFRKIKEFEIMDRRRLLSMMSYKANAEEVDLAIRALCMEDLVEVLHREDAKTHRPIVIIQVKRGGIKNGSDPTGGGKEG